MRRQSTIIEDKEFNIDGMVRMTMSVDTQKSLGCLIGNQVTSENPWTNVKKATVITHLMTKRANSEIYQFKDVITDYKDQEFLIGYIFTAEKSNQFYICLTEEARKNTLNLIGTNRIKHQKRVQSCISRKVKKWVTLDSGKEIQVSIPQHARPLLKIETIIIASGLYKPAEFQNQDPGDSRNGYVHFEPKKDKFVTVTRKHVDVAVQAVAEIDLSIAQTVPPLPSNVWMQYEYQVDIEQKISGEIEKNIKRFVHENSSQMADLVRYNGVFDLYNDDYPNLVKFEHDVQMSKNMTYDSYQSFMDVKNCKGKIISAVAWHPMLIGVIACAYIDQIASVENRDDDILHDVFCTNRVLVWSFSDSLNPKLVLGSPHDVYSLEFCPVNANILVGGCVNGQVVVWDISQKEENAQKLPELSEEKLKYHLALHCHLGWTGSGNKYTFLSPVLVSTLVHSSTSCIRDMKWLSPYYKLSRLGKYQDLKQNAILAMQFMSCSQDGTLCVWDLQSKSRVKFNRKKSNKKQKFSLLKPLYKLIAENPESSGNTPLTALALQPFSISYIPQQQAQLTKTFGMAQKLTYKPEFHKLKMHLKCKIYIGSMQGEVMQATWSGYEFNPGGIVNSETLKYKSRCDPHDGMVSSISLSPFNKDLFMSTGGKVIAVWRETVKDRPVFWRESKVKLTHGAWSLLCPSMFYVTRVDGAFEVWDFLKRSDKPIIVQSVSGDMLTGIFPNRLGLTQNLIGVADSSGIFHVFFIPCEHMKKDPKQKKVVTEFFNREMEYQVFVKECEDRWLECNAEILLTQKEAAESKEKRKEAEKKTRERAEREKKKVLEEKLEKKKLEKETGYMKEENAKKKWHDKQEKHLIGVLLEKKQLNAAELLQRKLPLIKMKEDEQKRRSKQCRQPFPDIVEELPKAVEKVVKGFKDMDCIVQQYTMEFKKKEETLLNFKNNNSFEYIIKWKQLLVEGLEQRRMIDITLYSNLNRIHRYLQAKYERQEAMKSRHEEKGFEKKSEHGKMSLTKTSEPKQKKKLDRRKPYKKMGIADTGKISDP